MTEWSTSYRWAGVTRDNFVGLLRHDARDVDKQNGQEVAHSNSQIRPAYTELNVSLVNDGAGNLVPMKRVEEAIAFLDNCIAGSRNTRQVKDRKTGECRTIPVAIRKDAAVAVEFVLMLDPRYTRDPRISDLEYDGMTPAQHAALAPDVAHMTADQIADVKAKLGAMVAEVVEVIGAHNVIAVTEQWDESHPHVQMLVVPRTSDGQISKKQVLGAPTLGEAQSKYSAMHDSMRKRLRTVGYEATFERVDSGRHHQPLKDFKESKDRKRREKAAIEAVERDAERLTGERHDLKTERAALAQRMAEVPTLRLKAQRDGYDEGRARAERDADLTLHAARRTLDQASSERDAAVAEMVRLNALRVEIERSISEAGPAPRPPSYDDLREEILAGQPASAIRFMKSTNLPNGQTLYDRYISWARLTFAREQGPLAAPADTESAQFHRWLDRTVAMQAKLSRAALASTMEGEHGRDVPREPSPRNSRDPQLGG